MKIRLKEQASIFHTRDKCEYTYGEGTEVDIDESHGQSVAFARWLCDTGKAVMVQRRGPGRPPRRA